EDGPPRVRLIDFGISEESVPGKRREDEAELYSIAIDLYQKLASAYPPGDLPLGHSDLRQSRVPARVRAALKLLVKEVVGGTVSSLPASPLYSMPLALFLVAS